jgi:hypothetical protein
MWMLLFFALPFVAIAYIGWHVWTLVPLPRLWRGLLIAIGVACFLTTFLNFGRVIDRMPLSLARLSYDVGNSTILILLYLVIIFLVLDLGRLVRLVPRAMIYQNFYTTVAITIGIFVVFFLGNIHYRHKIRVDLPLITSKPLTKPLRFVMISDLHLGYHNPRTELHRWVDLINDEHPDYVLIAGDIIDMSMRPLMEEQMAEEFQRIQAPIYACLGNHEYYSGEPRALQFYKDAGIHLLRDTCETVGELCIIGRDDRSNFRRKSLDKLMEEASPQASTYTIVLDHQPHQLEQAEKAGIDFQLSGHTHRGQIWPISWITDHIYECSHGSYQRGHTLYYVSSGIGLWGGKFRIGTQSEYIVAELTNN